MHIFCDQINILVLVLVGINCGATLPIRYYVTPYIIFRESLMKSRQTGVGTNRFNVRMKIRKIKLFSLEEQKVHGDLLQTFKLLSGRENANHEMCLNHNTTNVRSHSLKLSKYRNVTNYVGGDFSARE